MNSYCNMTTAIQLRSAFLLLFLRFFMYVFNLEIVLPSNFCTFYSFQKYSKRTSYFHFCPSFTLFQFSLLSSFQFCPISTSVQFSILSNVKFCQIFNSVKCSICIIFNFVQFSILFNFQFCLMPRAL